MKKIYILPNLFTTANFFCGVLALSWIFQGKFQSAAFIILLAMVFDFVDGQVARFYHATSRFGLEYDSLADFLTFGLAPAFLVYNYVLIEWGRIGIGLAFLYAVFAALRLARFNTQVKAEEKTNFVGLPSPISAGVLISFFIMIYRHRLTGWEKALPFIMIVLSWLMISNFTYPTLLTLQLKRKKPFLYLVALCLVVVIFLFWVEIGLVVGFVSYTLTGITGRLKRQTKIKKSEEDLRLHIERQRGDSTWSRKNG